MRFVGLKEIDAGSRGWVLGEVGLCCGRGGI